MKTEVLARSPEESVEDTYGASKVLKIVTKILKILRYHIFCARVHRSTVLVRCVLYILCTVYCVICVLCTAYMCTGRRILY